MESIIVDKSTHLLLLQVYASPVGTHLSGRDKADIVYRPVERPADGQVKDVGLQPAHEVLCHSKDLLLCSLPACQMEPVAEMLCSCFENIDIDDAFQACSSEHLQHNLFLNCNVTSEHVFISWILSTVEMQSKNLAIIEELLGAALANNQCPSSWLQNQAVAT